MKISAHFRSLARPAFAFVVLLPVGAGSPALSQTASQVPAQATTPTPAAPASANEKALMKAAGTPLQAVSADVQFYDEHVRPVLVQNCFKCHTGEAMGGLRLDSRASLLKGGDSGAAVVPAQPDKSLLIEAVKQTGDLKMPPKGAKLKDSEVADLVEWVKRGVPTDPNDGAKPILTNTAASVDAGGEFFENKIRPILSTECGSCHQASSGGGLSMVSRESMLKGGNSGPAMIPGEPDKSLLLVAVHQNTELRMPKFGRLSDTQIADLTEWIRMGAPWPAQQLASNAPKGKQITVENRSWWAFQPLHEYAVPADTGGGWARNDVDRFVLAKLTAKGLKPSKQADKLTLIRRATLDLTGLPPSPEEIAAFQADNAPDAWPKLVDRLLSSKGYGERWGRHWLDVARYGDDDIRGLDPRGRGYMPMAGAYTYRDWVIESWNKDLPYDQFIRMQLAGDLLSKTPKAEELKATGFLGGAPWIWDQAEPVQGRADERNERIDAVTRGMLGLTVACARCHDHKYDPVLQRDYYALGGVFANATYTEYNLVPDSEVNLWKEKFKELDAFQEASQDYNKTAAEQMSKAYAAQVVPYMVAAWQITGKPKQPADQVADRAKLDPEELDRWVKFLAKKPTFYPYLHDWQMMIVQGGSEDQARELAGSFQERVFALEAEAKKLEEENEKIKIKSGAPIRRKKDALPNEFETYDEFCPGCTLELKVMTPENANLYTDLFIRSLASDSERGDPGLFVYRGWGLRRRLGPAEQQYAEALEARVKKLKASVPEQYPFVHGMADKPKVQDIALNLRGNPHSLGDTVPRAFPAVLTTVEARPYTQGSGRLELAEDIVKSPLASRVIVNRVWRWHFGIGIVNTPDNFGKVGDPPSDPELLDYLAVQFRKNGMSLKKLQRLIMLSATYQQISAETPEAKQLDPGNRLYSHFPMQRLDAEQIRDSMLFVAGDLNNKEAGGPAEPLTPSFKKRTVYGTVSRFRIDPFLQAFDFPNPTFTAEQRFSTNVPVQRLFFMNSAFVYGQAGELVKRIYSKGSDDAARITEMYRILYGRAPSPQELQLGLDFLKTTPEKPGYVVNQEPETAWKQYARVLFSSNEFAYLR